MSFVDLKKVEANSGGDRDFTRELLNMGLERINASLTEMDAFLSRQDWEGLSRSIHKLRPLLCYAGIEAFNDDLLGMERDARENKGLEDFPARLGRITVNLQQARDELARIISEFK